MLQLKLCGLPSPTYRALADVGIGRPNARRKNGASLIQFSAGILLPASTNKQIVAAEQRGMVMTATRRVFLSGVALTLASHSLAQQRRSIRVRPGVETTEGQRNLRKYAVAVDIMSRLPASDPRSWTYQWYIHSVPTDRTKDDEIARLFPKPDAARELASACWSTCKAHFAGSDPDLFLPWHRAYLLCFERTLRSVLNDSGFMLPYWNYLDPAQRSLPAAFLKSPLLRPDRRHSVNGGAAIDAGIAQTPINGGPLGQPSYRPHGPRLGFCQEIDRTLHGSVHTLVGNGRGMGSVPWAANDPIFWLHHANIDRLWASWNANGGLNPSDDAFTNTSFVFPDGLGGRASIKCRDMLFQQELGYGYDRLEPGPRLTAATGAQTGRAELELGLSTGRIDIPAAGASVPLQKIKHPLGPTAVAGRRIFLILSGLSARTAPGVVYEVEIRDRQRLWVTVGPINFFDAVIGDRSMMSMPGMTESATGGPTFSFDVTPLVAGTGGVPDVRVMPAGAPEAAVSVSIERVRLVSY